jgi:hypothetical protein
MEALQNSEQVFASGGGRARWGAPDADTSTLADGTPIPASVARRMACAAGLIPVVLGGPSLKLDLGRAQRIASPAQRLALKTLWETCSFADCRAPLDWCEIHHTVPFNQHGGHGRTDLDQLTPICRHCHDLAHTPGWTFTKDPHTHATVTIAPDRTRWQREPNRRTEPPPAAATHPEAPEAPAATPFTHAA